MRKRRSTTDERKKQKKHNKNCRNLKNYFFFFVLVAAVVCFVSVHRWICLFFSLAFISSTFLHISFTDGSYSRTSIDVAVTRDHRRSTISSPSAFFANRTDIQNDWINRLLCVTHCAIFIIFLSFIFSSFGHDRFVDVEKVNILRVSFAFLSLTLLIVFALVCVIIRFVAIEFGRIIVA